MNDYVKSLKQMSEDNTFFRQVLETGEAMQVVIMDLKPGEEIGSEVHKNNEQVLLSMGGNGIVVIDGKEHEYNDGDMVLVRAGQEHNFINNGSTSMKIITIYSPPHHQDGIIHKSKSEADSEDE